MFDPVTEMLQQNFKVSAEVKGQLYVWGAW